MAFPEGMHDKQGQFVRPELRQPKKAYSAEDQDDGPGAAEVAAPSRQGLPPRGSRRSPGKRVQLESRNVHGLRSKSELLYPEAYAPVDARFWEGLTEEQQHQLMRLQAIAQEKVGFERHTKKYFIEDFDPQAGPISTERDLVTLATPRLVTGGVLLGAALTLGFLYLLQSVTDPSYLYFALGFLVAGLLTILIGNN
jgi:hypothetical protein